MSLIVPFFGLNSLRYHSRKFFLSELQRRAFSFCRMKDKLGIFFIIFLIIYLVIFGRHCKQFIVTFLSNAGLNWRIFSLIYAKVPSRRIFDALKGFSILIFFNNSLCTLLMKLIVWPSPVDFTILNPATRLSAITVLSRFVLVSMIFVLLEEIVYSNTKYTFSHWLCFASWHWRKY